MRNRPAAICSLAIATLFAGLSSSPAEARTQVLAAQGSWAALKFGDRCEALARPLLPAAARQPAARAGFSFDRTPSRGQFHVLLSRVPRAGSSVMLNIGDRPFMLVARGAWAWSRGGLQETAILEAARSATSMQIEGRDGSGRGFADRYLLNGAPTAIDAAAAGCAGKS